jgi:diguanylate cyclase (GGDEF)-like protein
VQITEQLRQQKASFDKTSLSLVSKDEFEDWLMVERGIRMLERELSVPAFDLRNILSALSCKDLDAEKYPLSPHSILFEFKQCLDQMDIPATTLPVLYRLLSDSLLNDLKSLYDDIKMLANKAGFKYTPEKTSATSVTIKAPPTSATPNPVEAKSQDARTHSSAVQSVKPRHQWIPDDAIPDQFEFDEELGLTAASDNDKQFSTLDTLSRLGTSVSTSSRLAQRKSLYTMSNAELVQQGGQSAFDRRTTNHLIQAISSLQQTQGKLALNNESLHGWLQQHLEEVKANGGIIGNQETELVDVTDRFFDVIVDKVGVSGVMAQWLDRLKLTILKVVLKDNTFFSDVDHPARQMLNKLAKLSRNGGENRKMEQLLDEYIDHVVSTYDQDEEAVGKVVEQLDTLIERQELAFKRNSERIARTYEGKQKTASARQQVVDDLNEILAGNQVPVILLELLDKAGFREYLALMAVRDGKNGESYTEALNVVSQLMHWFSGDVAESERWALELEMEMEVPSLLDMVRRELGDLGMAPLDSVLVRLEQCLLQGVKPIMMPLERYDWPYDKTDEDVASLQPSKMTSAEKLSHWHKRVMAMKIGDWIELREENGSPRCMRLAWSGSRSFRFVFVDSQGLKDEDVALDELVDKFRKGTAIMLEHDDVPLVDQGLHQMVQSVYEDLSTQSSCDVLTGLLNRQAFERGLKQAISTAISRSEEAALLYVDIDQFNVTNASFGHAAGDACLTHVANILRKHGNNDSYCGRLGGNEFGLLLMECPETEAFQIAQALCANVQQEHVIWEGRSIESTVSIGFTTLERDVDDFDRLLQKASQACEAAKQAGQNRVVKYLSQSEDQQKREALLRWVQKLDGNLDELLLLRCQEIRPISTANREASHFEILLGVRDNGQVLPPGLLIEAAEHFGRMGKVDRWVFHNVLNWMEANPSLVKSSAGFSINLSGNSLSDSKFLEFVLGELQSVKIDKSKLCFEITETAAITNLSEATEFIRTMKQQGCKFSLDDFGSGLSSYAYIQKLPVDYIKIDGIFIRNLATNHKDQALVRSINELAHFMGMKTVAEFVESHEILEVLKLIGVDHSQGYGIKKPGLLADLS